MNIEELFSWFMVAPFIFLLGKLEEGKRKREMKEFDKSIKGYLNSSYNTKLISLKMMTNLFKKVKKLSTI